MRFQVVRVASPLLVTCSVFALTACVSSTSPTAVLPAASQSSLRASTAATGIANATVHIIAALDGLDVVAINQSDEVVGGRGAFFFGRPPFRWERETGLHLLATNGAADAGAFGLNDRGDIVGFVTVNGVKHAAVWRRSGKLHILKLPPDSLTNSAASDCVGEGINIHREVVGRCGFNFVLRTPVIFRWKAAADESPEQLVPDGNLSSVSNDGWIGGASDQSDINHGAFLISPTGNLVNLLDAQGVLSGIAGVNAVTRHGWAAGFDLQGSAGACQQAVAWFSESDESFKEVLLGTPGSANGITADRFVVGQGAADCQLSGGLFAFVWSSEKGLQHLPGLGQPGETSRAVAINAKHHVLGGIVTGAGVTHTVIWDVRTGEDDQGDTRQVLAVAP
jgi:hypothetical protein